ncbi:hypothetical protein CCFV1_ORF008 [Cotesia congregata filamentous virus 1]|uniref:Uncharacterized protein n=1 Tax=Cotesia congregata filamentous virus 1 TaxID=3064291 RepID=A0ABC8QJH0_9VIRU|nr:hypothetical protein CCFV1_ORF008 [Cotesia congregata filamentous virus 1]
MGSFLTRLFEDDGTFEMKYIEECHAMCGRLSKSCENYGFGHNAREMCRRMLKFKNSKDLFDLNRTRENYERMKKYWPPVRDQLFLLISKMYETYPKHFLVINLERFVILQQNIIKFYRNYSAEIGPKEACERHIISNIDITDNNSAGMAMSTADYVQFVANTAED